MTTPATPSFAGTPDDWWNQAEQVTNAEAAERGLANWYISRHKSTGGYLLHQAKPSSNRMRKAKFDRDVAAGKVDPYQIDPKIRRLISIPEDRPEWLDAPLVLADSDTDPQHSQRIAFTRKGVYWVRLDDQRIRIPDELMAERNPAPAQITETPA